MHDLRTQGKTHTEICRILGLSDKTVRKFLQASTAEELIGGPRQYANGIDRFAHYLHDRRNAGCSDAAQLCKEIRTQGYRGSSRSVRRYRI